MGSLSGIATGAEGFRNEIQPVLTKVMDAILDVHRYEEPVIFIHENWAIRAEYDLNSSNPNRWWNDGRKRRTTRAGSPLR